MCKFFSMCSDGNGNPIYMDWKIRKQILDGTIKNVESPDSHTSIATYFGYKGLKEDKLNKYEYNPLTKEFTVDQINTTDDKSIIEKWVRELDFKTIVPPLNLYPIINPLEIKSKKIGNKELKLLKEWINVQNSVWNSVWDSVGNSVGDSVRNSVWDSVGNSVGDSVRNSVWNSVWNSVGDSVRNSVWNSVWNSVRDSVGDSVWNSVGDSVGALCTHYIKCDKWEYIDHEKGINPYQCCIDLYKKGLVPSFDGKKWRLHANKKADIVWEGTIKELNKQLTEKE